MGDSRELQRFVDAQEAGGTYEAALAELRRGRKTSHWMWFVFPQIAGLGISAMSQRYAIADLEEAQAYLRHPVLGRRLVDCAHAVLDADAPSAQDILGAVDAQKLHSSMTLFVRADPGIVVFGEVLDRYYDSVPDEATLRIVDGSAQGRWAMSLDKVSGPCR